MYQLQGFCTSVSTKLAILKLVRKSVAFTCHSSSYWLSGTDPLGEKISAPGCLEKKRENENISPKWRYLGELYEELVSILVELAHWQGRVSEWGLLRTKMIAWVTMHSLALVFPSNPVWNEWGQIPNSWVLPDEHLSTSWLFWGLPEGLAYVFPMSECWQDPVYRGA